MRYCGQCGAPNSENARFCNSCGSMLSQQVPQTNYEAFNAVADEVPTAQTSEGTAATQPAVEVPVSAEATPYAAPTAETPVSVGAEATTNAAPVPETSVSAGVDAAPYVAQAAEMPLGTAGVEAAPYATPTEETVFSAGPEAAPYDAPATETPLTVAASEPDTQAAPEKPAKKTQEGKTTALSILAFIFAIFLPPAGLVMGIIDLCMDDGRNRGLSIAAVVVSACIMAIFVVGVVLPVAFIMSVI